MHGVMRTPPIALWYRRPGSSDMPTASKFRTPPSFLVAVPLFVLSPLAAQSQAQPTDVRLTIVSVAPSNRSLVARGSIILPRLSYRIDGFDAAAFQYQVVTMLQTARRVTQNLPG